MNRIFAGVFFASALSALGACGPRGTFTDLPIETPKPTFEGAKVSGKRVAIVEVADARDDKATFFVADAKYTTVSNLRAVVMESFAATLQAAGFQTVRKEDPADIKLKLTLTVARAEVDYGKMGVGVVAVRMSAQTPTGTFERNVVGRDFSNPVFGNEADKVQRGLEYAIAAASVEATNACVELVKLELGGG